MRHGVKPRAFEDAETVHALNWAHLLAFANVVVLGVISGAATANVLLLVSQGQPAGFLNIVVLFGVVATFFANNNVREILNEHS
jgi:hypothetical protein